MSTYSLILLSFFIFSCGKTVKERSLDETEAVFTSGDASAVKTEEINKDTDKDTDKGDGQSEEQIMASLEKKCLDAGKAWEDNICIDAVSEEDILASLQKKCLADGHKWENNICIQEKIVKEEVEKIVEVLPENNLPFFASEPIKEHVYYSDAGDSIQLLAEIRDFSKSHSDFEAYNSPSVTEGLVNPVLGGDGNPIFSGTPGEIITNSTTFNQWYNDVEGTNIRVDKALNLTKVPNSNIYEYANDTFFPIDNEGYGNEGNIYNYHFTLKIQTKFTYQGGETFTFVGDDDLWVFIDNKLVIDLGGVHSQATKSVALDTLGLQNGKDYDFSLFFAERKKAASRFKVQSSIQLRTNTSYIYEPVALDADQDDLVFSLEQSPDTMMIDPATGKIEWAPMAADVGNHTIVIKVEDGKGGSAKQEFIIDVKSGS